MSTIAALFDQAIAMAPGSKLVVPTASFEQAERLRTGLYRERAKWEKVAGEDCTIIISRVKGNDGSYSIILAKEEEFEAPFIITKDGEMQKLTFKKGE